MTWVGSSFKKINFGDKITELKIIFHFKMLYDNMNGSKGYTTIFYGSYIYSNYNILY